MIVKNVKSYANQQQFTFLQYFIRVGGGGSTLAYTCTSKFNITCVMYDFGTMGLFFFLSSTSKVIENPE